MDDEFDEEEDTDIKIAEALNCIDPTGELASKTDILSKVIDEADAFAAGMYHGGKTGQQIMTFADRLYMVGYLIHTNNVIRALKHEPQTLDPCSNDFWSYQ